VNTLPEKFPVWQTAMDVLDYCWKHRRLMERFGWISLLVGIAASWGLLWFDVSMTEPSIELFAIALLQLLIFLAPTVTWYRIVAYGEQEAASRPILTLGRLEIRLLLWQILFLLGLAVPFAIAGGIIGAVVARARMLGGDVAAAVVAAPLVAVCAVAFIVAATRLTMILALAALDEPTGFKVAWKMTRGIAWRLTGALILIILAILLFLAFAELIAWLVGMIVAIATDRQSAEVLPYVRATAQAVVNLVGMFAIATLFGFVYRMRTRLLAPPATEPPASIPVL
jgi:hypothetical protein